MLKFKHDYAFHTIVLERCIFIRAPLTSSKYVELLFFDIQIIHLLKFFIVIETSNSLNNITKLIHKLLVILKKLLQSIIV